MSEGHPTPTTLATPSSAQHIWVVLQRGWVSEGEAAHISRLQRSITSSCRWRVPLSAATPSSPRWFTPARFRVSRRGRALIQPTPAPQAAC